MTMATRAGFAVWFTGLPASGKSTLARGVQQRLAARGIATQLLDSDEVRARLLPEPTYSDSERDWFYDLIVFLADLLTRNGVNVLIAATGQKRAYRDAARATIGNFCEVFVDCPPEICRFRDPKGLWEKAERGEIKNLPGMDAAYEAPLHAEAVIHNDQLAVEDAIALTEAALTERGCIP